MANTVDKVIKIALAEVGYLEKKSNSNLYSKTANAGSNNYTKYGKEMHDIYPSVMDFPAAWCDAFVDHCFYKAYGVANAKGLIGGDFNDYTVSSANLYKKKNAWYTSNPKIGDQIFFKNSKRICHTGLVYDVDSTYVYTVEGNTSGASGVIANGGGVCKKKYKLNDPAIAGYGRPKYDIEVDTYTVMKGDTLSKIGKKLGVAWTTIAKLNNIKAPYIIRVGQVLVVRDSGNKNTTPTTTTTTTTQTVAKPTTTAPAPTTKPSTTTTTSKPQGNAIVKKGQQHAINFTGVKIDVDGIVGSETNKMKARVLQHALNLDYGKTIAEDGDFQTKSKAKLGSHYVKKGEKQYMVTAAEILMELHGIDPNGVEMPGKYGNGLVKAAKKFFGDDGTKITANEFLKLIK